MKILRNLLSTKIDPLEVVTKLPSLEKYTPIQTTYNDGLRDIHYKLSDFYIAGSFNTQGTYINSLSQIQQVIMKGARFLSFNIYDNNFQNYIDDQEIGFGDTPIVRNDNKVSGLKFENVCKVIRDAAWSVEHNYPLIIYLNLKYNKYNINVSDQIAELIKKYFYDKYPDKKYCYSRYKLGNENIENFLGKFLLFTNRNNNGDKLNELTHAYLPIDSGESTFVEGHIMDKAADKAYINSKFMMKNLINKTKQDLVVLFQDGKQEYNFNHNNYIGTGINVLLMNYMFKEYLDLQQEFFKDGGFKPKEKNLRNNDVNVNKIIKHNPQISLENKQVKPVNPYGPNNLFL